MIYNDYKNSFALRDRSKRVLAQGFTGTNSKRYTQFPRHFPHYLEKAQKCYVWDVDGNQYIDFIGALGASTLGYNNCGVNDAVKAQLHSGYVSGSLPHRLEVEVAELITQAVPAMEKVRFLKTGSEACSAAVRIARAHTGLKNVYTSGYHGWHDLFTSLTPPAAGIGDGFQIFSMDEKWYTPAAVIQEPVMLDVTDLRKIKVEETEEKIKQSGGMVIYDEIITGCRVPKLCMTNAWDLEPDIVVLGKGIANGFPIAIVGGKQEVMDQEEYFVSSTFSGEALSLVAVMATLRELKTRRFKDLMYYGERLRNSLNDLDPQIEFRGYGTRAMLNITNPRTALFVQECAKAGILFGKAWFYNFSHLEEDVEWRVMNICHDVMEKVRRGKVKLEGPPPEETFTR